MDMVERVAKGICMSRHGGYEAYAENRAKDPRWHQAMKDARAAIEAMDQPTPEMIANEDVAASWRGCQPHTR